MKTLQLVCESLLGPDLDSSLDDEVTSEFAQFLIDLWQGISWKSTKMYDVCNALVCQDQAGHGAFMKTVNGARHTGKKNKANEKDARSVLFKNENKTVICIRKSNVKTLSPEYAYSIGIGNGSMNDAMDIRYQYMGGAAPGSKKSLSISTPAMHGDTSPKAAYWFIDGYNSDAKKEYYILPGHCFSMIKKAILG